MCAAVYGQPQSADTLRLALAEGAEAVKTGEQKRALELLEPVFVTTPSYVDSTHGSAAYWLGRALEADDYPEKAQSVLRSGVIVMNAKDQSNPRLTDAFVQRVFAEEDQANYELAAEAYRRMIRDVGTEKAAKNSEEREVLAQNLRHLALILPENIKQETGLPNEIENISPQSVSSVDGPRLLTWWRGQDPLPATEANERLRTHLRRVAHARKEYAHPEKSHLGFDERGEIYVRLGPPDHTVEINFDETRLTEMITSPGGVMVNLSDFPENEFWSYGDYDRRAYYIFVEKKEGDPFTTGTIEDMLPSQLRTGFTGGQKTSLALDPDEPRGKDRTMKAMATLRTIYRQYAPFHPDMAARHDEVANKISEVQMGMEAPGERTGGTFAQKTQSETRNQDAIAAMRREKHTPQQLGKRRKETEPFDVAVRTARFLEEDGATRTDVSWAPTAGAFVLGEDQRERLEENGYDEVGDYLLRLTAVQKTADYRNRAVEKDHIRVREGVVTETGTIPARTFSTEEGDSTLYHLGLQWDQYLVDAENDEVGPKVKVATTQQDSLKPLVRDESVLEMSDLKPMILPEGKRTLQAAQPYPFQEIYPSAPLALYFEVYHLPFNSNDRTEYTVEYEIQGIKERGDIMEFFRGKNEEQTTVSTTQQGSSRTTEEYILLDLSEWEEGNDLSVTVRVKDETTGQEIERSVDFQLRAPKNQ